jgi:N-acetyl-gamma-glutamyl-phosphate reductase
MKIGVVGASGYAGGELLRLLADHPVFDSSYISAGSNAGEWITSIHPQLSRYAGAKFAMTSVAEINNCDLVFFALPHGESAKLIAQISPQVKVVDLGADFRLTSESQWKKYYGGDYAGSWSYGLPEITPMQELADSSRIANPGCYATAIALSIAPAISAHFIAADDVVVVAASGTTGAGRSAKVNLLGSEVMNSLSSYKFGGVHQHTPEIEQVLSRISGEAVKISFTPILAPMPRGILATTTARLSKKMTADEVRAYYAQFYSSPFVQLLPEGRLPMTSSVLGTNNVQIQIAIDDHTDRLVVSTAIDNLGKGAAAQAIQNANIIAGLDQSTGLTAMGAR